MQKYSFRINKLVHKRLCPKNILFVLLLSFAQFGFAQDIPGLSFGGQKNEVGFDIIQCSDKGYLITGSTKSYGAGSSDFLAIKLDYNANIEWMNTYGWPHHDISRSVVEVEDGYILLGDAWDYGYSLLDMYMTKIDLSGNYLWHKYHGTGSRDLGFDMLKLPLGDLLLLGYTRGEDPAGDLMLVRTDAEGNEIWRNTFGSGYDDYGIEMVLNDDDTFLVIGTKAGFYYDVASTYYNVHDADVMLLCIDFDGNEVWRKISGGSAHDFGYSLVNSEDGFYICGSTQSTGNGNFDMFLQKTNKEGDEEWLKTFGGVEYDYGYSMAKSVDDELYLFGTTKSFGQDNSADFYLVKTNDDGDEIWSLTIGGSLIEYGYKVIATADSGAIVIGQTNSYGNGGFDILMVKVDKNGIIEDLVNGIDSLYAGEFQLYPNPLSGEGHFRTLSSMQIPELFLEIFSISGQPIKSYTINTPDYTFPTYSLSSGVYIYHIKLRKDSETIFRGKLIVR